MMVYAHNDVIFTCVTMPDDLFYGGYMIFGLMNTSNNGCVGFSKYTHYYLYPAYAIKGK